MAGMAQAAGGGVVDRARPAYDAAGIHAGGFTVFPAVTATERYDDNIYATDTNTTDDYITELGASVAVLSNWSRHSLNFNANVLQYLYADNTDENRLDWNVAADGTVDVTRNTQLIGGLGYREAHEDRGDPNAPAAALEPTKYDVFDANAGIGQRFNRMIVKLSGTYSDYNYFDVPMASGGAPIDQDYRDHKEVTEALRVGYDVSPDTNVYAEGTLVQVDYDISGVLDRSSDGYSVVGGSDFKITNLINGGIYAGYQSRTYDDSALYPDVSGMSYGADVSWFATTLTTVTLTADSIIEETTVTGASGDLSQTVGLRIDHELLPNLLLNGSASYGNEDYEGVTRSDDVVKAGLGVNYLMNRNLSLSLGYDYTDRDSNVVGVDYKRNEIGLTLKAGL